MNYLENFIAGTKVICAGFEKDLIEWLASSPSPWQQRLCINYSCLFQQEPVILLSSLFPNVASRSPCPPTVSSHIAQTSQPCDWFYSVPALALRVPVFEVFPWFSSNRQKNLEDEGHEKPKVFPALYIPGILHELNQSISLRKPSKESIMCLLLYVRKVRIREVIALFFVTWLLNVVSVLFDFKAHFSVLCPKPVVL